MGVSDVEDGSSSLTVSVQQRAPDGDWSGSYLSSPWYNSSSSKWEANFTPSVSAVPGDYDIRVKVVDTDNNASAWSTYSDNITVLNNLPTLQDYNVSAASVLRSSTIVIVFNTTDVEDAESLSLIHI